jgi:hypothetical protein
MEGVVRLPSEFAMTTGSPPSMMATQELVVPRSIPMTLLMIGVPPLSESAVFKLVTVAGKSKAPAKKSEG